ncbi:MAG: DNA repair protein RadC [Pseudomonadota bacterium]
MAKQAIQCTDKSAEKPHYHGHRERLRQRFFSGRNDALPDYELLELALFFSRRQGDTKPTAKALLAEFGSFANVINAPIDRLKDVKGVGDQAATLLKVIQAATLRVTKTQISNKPVLSSWADVLSYLHAVQAYEPCEIFRTLYLDKKNRLIGDEEQNRGTVDHTPVYIREVLKRALEHSATALILVHNHPSGDPQPSEADITMTRQIIDAAKPLGISVHDHIIVGRQGHKSLRKLGVM